jgi:hypothetical protein
MISLAREAEGFSSSSIEGISPKAPQNANKISSKPSNKLEKNETHNMRTAFLIGVLLIDLSWVFIRISTIEVINMYLN